MAKTIDKEVNEWIERLKMSKTVREPYATNWLYWQEMYDDNMWGGTGFLDRARRTSQNKAGYIAQVNLLESIILTIIPAIHFYSPVFEITPVFEEYRYAAQILEVFALQLYRLLDIDDTIEELVLDALILGTGIAKVGYSYEVADTSYQLGDSTAGDPEITSENVFIGDVSPLSLRWDYRAKKWKDLRWLSEVIVKPLEEIRRDDNYKNTRDLVANLSFDTASGGSRKSSKKDKDHDLVRLHEIHDLENSKIITIAEGHNKVLRKDDDYGFHIYEPLVFTKCRPSRVFGKSLAQSIEEHIIEVSKEMHYMSSHGKRAGTSKLMIESSLVNKKVIGQLKSSEDFELMAIDGVTQGEPIRELKFTQPGIDWMMRYNLRDQIVRGQTGVPLQDRGRHEPGVETAYEVAKLAEASDRRNQHRIKKLNRFVARIMEKILRIATENYQPSEIADMVGLPAQFAPFIKPFDKMRLNVKFGSTALAARQEKLANVTQFVGLASQMGIEFDPVGITRLLAEAFNIELRENMILTGTPFAGGVEGGKTRSPAASQQTRLGARNNLQEPR